MAFSSKYIAYFETLAKISSAFLVHFRYILFIENKNRFNKEEDGIVLFKQDTHPDDYVVRKQTMERPTLSLK